MAKGITADLREVIRAELESDLPAKLRALGAPIPPTGSYLGVKRAVPAAELLPCVMVQGTGWREDEGTYSAGATPIGERIYSYYVWALVTGGDENEAQDRIEAYADAIDSVLSGNTFEQTNVVDCWVSNVEISASLGGKSELLQALRATVSVKYYHTVGDTTL
jgi:hypothetical protein